MKKIIENYLTNIIIDETTPIEKKVDTIKNFFEKISKQNRPSDDRLYKIDNINIKQLIYWFYRKEELSQYSILCEISEEIEKIIKYNENMVIFSKYI